MRNLEEKTQEHTKKFLENIKEIEQCLNQEYLYFGQFLSVESLHEDYSLDYEQLINRSIFHNIEYLYTTLELTKKGCIGPARMLFRNVYESLIIVKAILISGNEVTLQKWADGKTINTNREITQKINNVSNRKELMDFWEWMCKFSHGTTFSFGYIHELEEDELAINLNIIKMLLYLNYHVLNSYAFKHSMKMKFERLSGEKTMQNELHDPMKILKNSLSDACREIVNEFTRNWKFG